MLHRTQRSQCRALGLGNTSQTGYIHPFIRSINPQCVLQRSALNIPEVNDAIFPATEQCRTVRADTQRTNPALVSLLRVDVGSTLCIPPADHAGHAAAKEVLAILAPSDARDHTGMTTQRLDTLALFSIPHK